MVAGQCEQCRHKGFLHVRYLLTHILHEGLVANAPPAVILLVALCPWVGIEILTTIVRLELRSTGKGHEAHRAALSAMEESRLVAFAIQTVCQTRHSVHAVGRQEERLYKHRYGRQYRRHAVYGLTPVAV